MGTHTRTHAHRHTRTDTDTHTETHTTLTDTHPYPRAAAEVSVHPVDESGVHEHLPQRRRLAVRRSVQHRVLPRRVTAEARQGAAVDGRVRQLHQRRLKRQQLCKATGEANALRTDVHSEARRGRIRQPHAAHATRRLRGLGAQLGHGDVDVTCRQLYHLACRADQRHTRSAHARTTRQHTTAHDSRRHYTTVDDTKSQANHTCFSDVNIVTPAKATCSDTRLRTYFAG